MCQRHPRVCLAAVVVAVVWGLMTHGTFAGSGDPPHYIITAQSLAFDRDLDLADEYADSGNLIAGDTLAPDAHARIGRDGRLRPVHDIGLPLVYAPVVAIAEPLAITAARVLPAPLLQRARLDRILIFRHLTGLAMAIVAALFAVQLFEVFRRTATMPVAAGWALLVTLSPPFLAHAFIPFTEMPSALLALWLFRLLSEPDDRPVPWFAIGLATGFLLLLHIRNISLVAVFGLWAVTRLRRTRAPIPHVVFWSIGTLTCLGIRSAAMYTFWGTWLTSPHAATDLSLPLFLVLREAWIRASGLALDQEFGLIPYAPLYLLGPAGAVALWRSPPGGRWALLLAGSYVATIVLAYINVHGWVGGWSPPARMITPAVPFLALAVFASARAASARARTGVWAIAGAQIVIDAVIWQWPKSLWNYADGTAALWSGLPAVQRVLPTWHGVQADPQRFVWFLAAWVALTALLLTQSRVPAKC